MKNNQDADDFKREIEAMGKHFQSEAVRLASLRMYKIVYEPDEILPAKKRPARKKRDQVNTRAKKEKMRDADKRDQPGIAGSLIIDLDPLTQQPIRFSIANEDDIEKHLD